MQVQTAYCSACDHDVRIAVTDVPVHGGQANLPDEPQIVCLDFGERCTGALCPMFGVGNVIMGVRLARSGLREEWKTLRAQCPGCEELVELQVIDASNAFCPACHVTVRYSVFEADDADYVALAGV
jgi:hypothetical protein